jgi:secreted trypsin-like serine protease
MAVFAALAAPSLACADPVAPSAPTPAAPAATPPVPAPDLHGDTVPHLPKPTSVRVAGGRPIGPFDNPWQVELYGPRGFTPAEVAADRKLAERDSDASNHLWQRQKWDIAHRCGGSYIGGGWVLLAAHCVKGGAYDPIKDRRVHFGSNVIAPNPALRSARVDRVVIHAGYTGRPGSTNDIAMLKLAGPPPTEGPALRPIALVAPRSPAAMLAEGTPLRVTGWGMTKPMDPGARLIARDGTPNFNTAELKTIDVQVRPFALCQSLPTNTGVDPAKVICAGSLVAGRDACMGDSGGPLTLGLEGRRVLVGVVSFGDGCGLPQYPGVYTRVSYYAGWIARAKSAPAGKITRQR